MNLQVIILIPKYFGRDGWNDGKMQEHKKMTLVLEIYVDR